MAGKSSKQPFEAKVSIKDIPPEGLTLSYEDMPGLLMDQTECSANGPIKANVTIRNKGKKIELYGSIEASLRLRCHRCLNYYINQIIERFHYIFMESPKWHKDEDIQLDKEDIEISYYTDDYIDLSGIFREQILLQLPMRQLCTEDCKGLCPGCGADLNTESCRCQRAPNKGPFSILTQLKIQTSDQHQSKKS